MKLLPVFALAGVLVFCPRAFCASEKTVGSSRELQRIKREMRQKQKEIKRADRKERSILSELDRIDKNIQSGKTELAEQLKQLREAENSLREVERNNASLSRELTELKQLYALRLQALYKMSRTGYGIEVLLSPEPRDPFRRVKFLAMIAERDQGIIRDYGDRLDRLAVQQAEIAGRREDLIERKRAIEVKKSELQARKQNKAVLLASVREKKNVYEESLRELEESSASLWAMIQKAEKERMAAKTMHAQQQARVREADGRLTWPIEGPVLTRFGLQHHPQFKTMVFRRGIEIAAREGDPVHAASDGLVAFADWYKGYGKLMIIEHGPGFYTLYGNLFQLNVAKGDRVVRGQVIGLAGETGSVKGATLYFELRRNGQARDPLLWLAHR